MHLVNFALLITVLLLIVYYRESFIASYDMMINRASDPIFVTYFGREKDAMGNDYYDHLLKNQIQHEYIKNSSTNGAMQMKSLQFTRL
jgi:hypothetical protein